LNKSALFSKKYTHIFFDLDNTLWDFNRNSKSAMQEAFDFYRLNMQADFEKFFDIYTEYNHQLWALYRNNEVGKKELTRLRFQNTFEDLNISGVDPEKMNETYLNVMPKQTFLNQGASELLQYLKSKKYQLFVITNGFKEVQYNKIKTSSLKPFFQKVFVSEEIKTPKPGREIFEYAVKSSNAKKSKSIMVGDDWETDILGAVNFGIDAIHFLNDSKIEFNRLQTEINTNQNIFQSGTLLQMLSSF